MTNHINTRKKVSSGGRWTDIEKENLKTYIENGCLLSEIENNLSGRTGDAILAQARKMGYGEQKLDSDDKGFIVGVKYRGSNKEKSAKTSSYQPSVFENIENITECQNTIIADNDGKQITLTALSMLELGYIQPSPDSVRDMSLLILQYRS